MSGHSKWHSIKHKKGALDAKRGKIFTKHAKLIAIAARNGAEIETNPSLRTAIDNAKADNVPNMNIDRAIQKGSGKGKDAVSYEEIFYEGKGPNGISLYIHTITDNKNRTSSDIRLILSRKGGALGATGSSSWVFDQKGLITVPLKPDMNLDEMELSLIDAGASDIKRADDLLEVFTNFTDLAHVRGNLTKAGIQFDSAEVAFIPKQTVKVTTKEDAEKVLALIEAIEENDDVSDVYANFDIEDEILEQLS